MLQRHQLTVQGRVQGVGFRPFVYRLAQTHGLTGWIRNENGTVSIEIQGPTAAINTFIRQLLNEAPPNAQPALTADHLVPLQPETAFSILASAAGSQAAIHIPLDLNLCETCRQELFTPEDRRYRYPFINCTNCGPRYSIIHHLPYDRVQTSMAGFPLCEDCAGEYTDPTDRRFHAEPIACPVCGPQLTFDSGEQVLQQAAALTAAVHSLRNGEVILLKGIGGYHICCDALNPAAIDAIRQRKPRPHKPLAVMFPVAGEDELDRVRLEFVLSAQQAAVLRSPSRPIVLLQRQGTSRLPDNIAPHMQEVGVMLPYSPLHYLLLEQLQNPIIATSANLSGEPVLTGDQDVQQRLAHVTNRILLHNREIHRPVDDPVLRVIADQPRPLRLGRGTAPLELALPFTVPEPLLACGGHMKNTIALAWQDRIVISPHIGDLDSVRSQQVYQQTIHDMQDLYAISATRLVCDAHPGYASTRWARATTLPVMPVYHHHAHASVLAGEYPKEDRWLVFTWDGVGLGEDNTLWGGEALLGRPAHWQRVASWRPFRLPGGDKVAREPWRSALSLCWETGTAWPAAPADTDLLYSAWQKQVNTAQSTAVGRLFDAAAALTGVCRDASFEGQGPMWLEQCARAGDIPLPRLPVEQGHGMVITDWAPLLPMLLDEQQPVPLRAHAFHAVLADSLVEQAVLLRQQYGEFAIGLCGGVFQNRLLTELVLTKLAEQDLRAYLPEHIPVNDAGLCYGQLIEAQARLSGF